MLGMFRRRPHPPPVLTERPGPNDWRLRPGTRTTSSGWSWPVPPARGFVAVTGAGARFQQGGPPTMTAGFSTQGAHPPNGPATAGLSPVKQSGHIPKFPPQIRRAKKGSQPPQHRYIPGPPGNHQHPPPKAQPRITTKAITPIRAEPIMATASFTATNQANPPGNPPPRRNWFLRQPPGRQRSGQRRLLAGKPFPNRRDNEPPAALSSPPGPPFQQSVQAPKDQGRRNGNTRNGQKAQPVNHRQPAVPKSRRRITRPRRRTNPQPTEPNRATGKFHRAAGDKRTAKVPPPQQTPTLRGRPGTQPPPNHRQPPHHHDPTTGQGTKAQAPPSPVQRAAAATIWRTNIPKIMTTDNPAAQSTAVTAFSPGDIITTITPEFPKHSAGEQAAHERQAADHRRPRRTGHLRRTPRRPIKNHAANHGGEEPAHGENEDGGQQSPHRHHESPRTATATRAKATTATATNSNDTDTGTGRFSTGFQ